METHVPLVIRQCFGISHGKSFIQSFLIVHSMSRWEKELDWMAMNGINLVYATTGMESIFNKVCIVRRDRIFYSICFKVFLRFGFPQSELDEYFTGPAFLAW